MTDDAVFRVSWCHNAKVASVDGLMRNLATRYGNIYIAIVNIVPPLCLSVCLSVSLSLSLSLNACSLSYTFAVFYHRKQYKTAGVFRSDRQRRGVAVVSG